MQSFLTWAPFAFAFGARSFFAGKVQEGTPYALYT